MIRFMMNPINIGPTITLNRIDKRARRSLRESLSSFLQTMAA
jgi:hypothetical protein